jgi:hypothetical protein
MMASSPEVGAKARSSLSAVGARVRLPTMTHNTPIAAAAILTMTQAPYFFIEGS